MHWLTPSQSPEFPSDMAALRHVLKMIPSLILCLCLLSFLLFLPGLVLFSDGLSLPGPQQLHVSSFGSYQSQQENTPRGESPWSTPEQNKRTGHTWISLPTKLGEESALTKPCRLSECVSCTKIQGIPGQGEMNTKRSG